MKYVLRHLVRYFYNPFQDVYLCFEEEFTNSRWRIKIWNSLATKKMGSSCWLGIFYSCLFLNIRIPVAHCGTPAYVTLMISSKDVLRMHFYFMWLDVIKTSVKIHLQDNLRTRVPNYPLDTWEYTSVSRDLTLLRHPLDLFLSLKDSQDVRKRTFIGQP